jgi:hypothetical protein
MRALKSKRGAGETTCRYRHDSEKVTQPPHAASCA